MTVRWLDAPLTNEQRFSEARSYFPQCYSNEFDQCIDKFTGTYPNCKRLLELWGTDKNDPVSLQLDAEIKKMPYCAAPAAEQKDTSTTLLIVGAVGLAVGVVIARVLA